MLSGTRVIPTKLFVNHVLNGARPDPVRGFLSDSDCSCFTRAAQRSKNYRDLQCRLGVSQRMLILESTDRPEMHNISKRLNTVSCVCVPVKLPSGMNAQCPDGTITGVSHVAHVIKRRALRVREKGHR